MDLHPPDRADAAERLRAHLAAVRDLRAATRAAPALARDRRSLREWQAGRLARTHRDLLESPRYGAAATFFLSDLYGPKDLDARDAAIARILPMLTRVLPATALDAVALAVELDALSERLDLAVARALRRAQPEGPLVIAEASYAAAFRVAAPRDERERQIDLVVRIGTELDALARKRLLAGAIAMMEAPARAAGLQALHEFLARGFHTFRGMRGADEFLATIEGRERRLVARLYAGTAQPFAPDPRADEVVPRV
jgi:hypothetical protein